jgi:cell division protein FtsB
MVRSVLIGFFRGLNQLLQAPQKVMIICLGLLVLNGVIDGSLFRLWSLHRGDAEIRQKIEVLKVKNEDMKMRLKKAKDPAFLEREARDRFDLVNEGDLVFVFSEEEGDL